MANDSELTYDYQVTNEHVMSSKDLYSNYPNRVASTDLSNYFKNKVSKNIHVNPLCRRNIHVNKSKLAATGLDVSTKNLAYPLKKTNEKIYYNPKFLQTATAVNEIPTKVHVNPNYLKVSVGSLDKKNLTITHSVVPLNPPSIHINRNFLSETTSIKSLPCNVPEIPKSYQNLQANSESKIQSYKYKLIKKQITDENKPNVIISSPKSSQISKYKYVNKTVIEKKYPPSTQGIKLKSKYSIRQCTPLNSIQAKPMKVSLVQNIKKSKHISSDFKKFSKTKLVRKSALRALIEKKKRKITQMLKYRSVQRKITNSKRRSLVSKYKLIRSNRLGKGKIGLKSGQDQAASSGSTLSNEESVFKSVSFTKLVRKSVLQKHIESRRQVRTAHINLSKMSPENYVNSKYKIVRKNNISQKYKKETLKEKRRKQIKLNNSKKRGVINSLTKQLRKNNQLCVFYNRFGRCKGKDRGTCTKIHDAKYVAICRKLLQGECSNKDCLLSHDVRPEKMPTCLHYLAGLCTRSDCPFLHIKVNQKAPICNLFLQGFCADVYNCTKRHEYICPIFAEKGMCPKGKSCVYPHRSHTIRSKLLGTDQKPLILNPSNTKSNSNAKNDDNNVNDKTDDDLKDREEVSSGLLPLLVIDENISKAEDDVSFTNIVKSESQQKNELPKAFTRYFSMPFTFDPNCDNESEADSSGDDISDN